MITQKTKELLDVIIVLVNSQPHEIFIGGTTVKCRYCSGTWAWYSSERHEDTCVIVKAKKLIEELENDH